MHWKIIATLLVTVLSVALVGSAISAQTGDGFDLSWNVMGGGGAGGPLTGNGFSLRSTLGQTAIGTSDSANYGSCLGYWCGADIEYKIYLPLVLRNFS